MKTKLFAVLSILIISQASFAQGFEGKGDAIFSPGVSFGSGQFRYFDGYNQQNLLPPLTIQLEVGIHDWFSVGPYFGWETRSFKGVIDLYRHQRSHPHEYPGSGYWEWSERWFTGGLRLNWYVTSFFNDKASANIPEQLHVYLGLLGGISHYSKPGEYFHYPYRTEYNYTQTLPSAAVALSFRYMFTPGVGAFLEGYLGEFYRNGTLGLAVKF